MFGGHKLQQARLENAALTARKRPSQKRSRQTVEKILEAARELIKENDANGSSRITTHHIAKRAGISVGSLYQYFPNSDAIIFEVYQEILDQVQRILDEFDSAANLSLPREEFFDQLNRRLTKAEPDVEIVLAMLHVTKRFPKLLEEERKHAERVAGRIAGFLKHYGSAWSTAKLERLVLFVFYLDHGSWMYRDHARPSNKEVLDWEARAFNHVLMQCFED